MLANPRFDGTHAHTHIHSEVLFMAVAEVKA